MTRAKFCFAAWLVVLGVATGVGSFLGAVTALAADPASSFQVLVEEQASGFRFSIDGGSVSSVRLEILVVGAFH